MFIILKNFISCLQIALYVCRYIATIQHNIPIHYLIHVRNTTDEQSYYMDYCITGEFGREKV